MCKQRWNAVELLIPQKAHRARLRPPQQHQHEGTVPVLPLYKGNYPPPPPCGVDAERQQLPTKKTRFTPFCYMEWFNGTFIEEWRGSGPGSARCELWILMYAVDFHNTEQFVIALPRCCFQSSCYITSIYFWPQNYIYSTESSSGSLRG